MFKGQNVQWTQCPIDSMPNGHHVQWTPCPMCTMDPMDIVFNGHDVQWIQWTCPVVFNGSNGSIGHNGQKNPN